MLKLKTKRSKLIFGKNSSFGRFRLAGNGIGSPKSTHYVPMSRCNSKHNTPATGNGVIHNMDNELTSPTSVSFHLKFHVLVKRSVVRVPP